MKKDILLDFLDDHIEFNSSFDEIKDQIMIPSVKRQKKSTLWFKILIPAFTCLLVVVLGINIMIGKNLNQEEMIPPVVDNSTSDQSNCELTPYQGDVVSVLKKQYALDQATSKQTILGYLRGNNVIYELSYRNGLVPESYMIAYMPMEDYNALKNKEMDGTIINDLISNKSSLTELKWFTSSTHKDIEVVQSSYHLAAIYAVGKVEIINSDQRILNQLSYIKPLNIPLDSQVVSLDKMNMNLSNYWFMTQATTDVTAWKGYLEEYVTSNMMIAKIENSIVEFDYYFDNSMDYIDAASMDFINYLDAYHIELTKYNYEGLLKHIETYKERKKQ